MIHAIGKDIPQVDATAFVAWNAEVAGKVRLGEHSSVWFSATLRGDMDWISVGKGSNLQDGVVVHVEAGVPCTIGENVTIGHRAILHGCTVGNGSLIGMGSIVLDGAEIGAESVVGAGALVTQGKKFPPRSLIIGSPARAIRSLSDEDVERLQRNALGYMKLAAEAKDYRLVEA